MRRNLYAVLLLCVLGTAVFGSQAYVKACSEELKNCIRESYACTVQGNYAAAKEGFLRTKAIAKQKSSLLSLVVRRSLLDKVNETLSSLPHYAVPDNQADLAVEAARACEQLDQLTDCYNARF